MSVVVLAPGFGEYGEACPHRAGRELRSLRQATRNIRTFESGGRNDTPDLRRGESGLTAAAS